MNNSPKKVYLREYTPGPEILVAVCDQDVLGQTFREGKMVLKVSSKFFGGDLVEVSYAINRISKATIANLIGNCIVDAAIQAKLIHPDAIVKVEGIAHAQRMTM
jgi:hypothetical protein